MKVIHEEGARPIHLWTDDIEPEAMQQLKNAARLPFLHPHGIAGMPDCHFGIGATVGSVIATERAIVPAAVGVDIGCLSGDTKVCVLEDENRGYTFLELVKRDKAFFVTSYDVENAEVRVAEATAKMTRREAELVQISLATAPACAPDSVETIDCTPDHQFLCLDGKYKTADNLVAGDALMPVFNEEDRYVVLSVVKLAVRQDVYCLTVPKYHNFALAAGVFVHNCGMIAAQTSLTASDLPDSLAVLRHDIERSVPLGSGASHQKESVIVEMCGALPALDKGSAVASRALYGGNGEKFLDKAAKQLGTLGSGNHFIEVCLDENQAVWVMLHSGSRGIGNQIGRYFITRAKKIMEQYFITLPDADLAYLPDGTQDFDDYIAAMNWAQEYALENRRQMMRTTLRSLEHRVKPFELINEAINTHHNYTALESHFGRNVWLTRKGAIRARKGDLGIIPSNMGQKSYIVRGKGNPDSYHSCSHGAGRAMSRTAARKAFTVADLEAQTAGVECRKDAAVLDELPSAYKSIDAVMANQADLVDIVATLKQVLCVKGT